MPSVFRYVTENWKLKLLALALAVLLWVVISSEQVTTNWVSVPLQIQVTDPDYRVASTDVPDEVEVRFTGPARDLLDLALRRPPLRLTIAEVNEPIETRTLDPRTVQIPAQIAVNPLEVRPSTIRLEFLQMQTRSVPVRVRVESDLGSDWAVVDSIVTEPSAIRVRGPREAVSNVNAIPTEPIEITAEDSIFSRVVPLDTRELSGLELSATSVQVTGRLDRVIERAFEDVQVDVGPGITVAPEQVDVVIRGPRTAVEAVTPELFRIVVSIGEIPSRIPPGGVPVPLRIDGLRADVQATVTPSAVRLFPAGPQIDTLFAPNLAPTPDTLSQGLPDNQ